MNKITVLKYEDADVSDFDWGRLTWFASGKLGNSDTMTVGLCEIRPGCSNPRHSHPNCEEVLHVVQGTIAHTADGGSEAVLSPGDTVSVPANIVHNARNIGDELAVLSICFSSADRETAGE